MDDEGLDLLTWFVRMGLETLPNKMLFIRPPRQEAVTRLHFAYHQRFCRIQRLFMFSVYLPILVPTCWHLFHVVSPEIANPASLFQSRKILNYPNIVKSHNHLTYVRFLHVGIPSR